MVKIYFDDSLNDNIVVYTFDSLFKYIDIDYTIVNQAKEADIIYADLKTDKIKIIPNLLFWNNYKKVESLPRSPLSREEDIPYIYEKDLIASTFFMLSGYEEYLNLKRDIFDRFLYQYSSYTKDGIYDIPLVERYRENLIVQLNASGITCNQKNIFNNKKFGLFLTHDVDGVYKYRNSLKSILKIILKPSKFSFKELIASKKKVENDPYFKGFEYLIKQSNKYKFKSTFFFISKVREKLDYFYNIDDPAIVNIVQKIRDNRFEIGLHGSLKSSKNKEYLKEEKYIMKDIVHGVRQHYLEYDIMLTPLIQNKLFTYDSTLCFADMIGFRRGTCLPFFLFNLNDSTVLDIYEIPLNVMDITLKEYMHIPQDVIYEKLVDMMDEIKKYHGVFALLWHPGNCSDEWEIWLKNIYEPILQTLFDEEASSLTGNQILRLVKNEI